MVNEIKNLRVKIDGLGKLVESLKPLEIVHNRWLESSLEPMSGYKIMENSKEIEKAAESLYLAKAWLGKIMGELGESTPYANDGKRKTVEDIEPIADEANHNDVVSNHYDVPYKEISHIEKVDFIRQEIQNIIDGDYDFCEDIPYIELEQGFVYKYLCEARFWLGFELQRIKEVEK
jgi:hypothetical protein